MTNVATIPSRTELPQYMIQLHVLAQGRNSEELKYMRNYLNTEAVYANEAERSSGKKVAPVFTETAAVRPDHVSEPDQTGEHSLSGTRWVHNANGATRIPGVELSKYLANGYSEGKKPADQRKPAPVAKGSNGGKRGVAAGTTQFMFKGSECRRIPNDQVDKYRSDGWMKGRAK